MSPLVAPLRAICPVVLFPEMTPLETWSVQLNLPMQGPTLTPAQFPSNDDPSVAALSLRRGGWLARLTGGFLATLRLVSSSPPEIDLSRLPIVPPVLPACAKAVPANGTDTAATINMLAAQVNARID